MRYAQIRETDIANGEGIRVSLFVQGCPFRCKDCFNEDFQNFSGGKEWNADIEQKFIDLGKRPYIKGYSMLGGEPMAQDEDFLNLLKRIKEETAKTIWVWTGYLFENLNEFQKECLKYVDVLVDGPFVDELKDIKLKFKGSSNQRLIDVQKTLNEKKIVLWEEE